MKLPDKHAETAPALAAVWRHLAPRLMELNRVEPRLLPRLTMAPKQAFHAYCAWISATAFQPAELCAPILNSTPPKTLLLQALALAEPGPVWRALKRLEAHALDLAVYLRLSALVAGPVGDALRAQDTISTETLDAAELLERRMAGCALLQAAAPGINPLTTADVERCVEALSFLKAHGAADFAKLAPALRRARSTSMLRGALATGLRHCRLPDFGLPTEPCRGFRRIDTIEGLRLAGKDYENCLRQLPFTQIVEFLRGHALLLEYRAAGEKALVKLDLFSAHSTPMLASVESILGPRNEAVAFEAKVRAALAEIPGLAICEPGLGRAIHWMNRAAPAMDWHDAMMGRIQAEAEAPDLDPDMFGEEEDDLVPL